MHCGLRQGVADQKSTGSNSGASTDVKPIKHSSNRYGSDPKFSAQDELADQNSRKEGKSLRFGRTASAQSTGVSENPLGGSGIDALCSMNLGRVAFETLQFPGT